MYISGNYGHGSFGYCSLASAPGLASIEPAQPDQHDRLGAGARGFISIPRDSWEGFRSPVGHRVSSHSRDCVHCVTAWRVCFAAVYDALKPASCDGSTIHDRIDEALWHCVTVRIDSQAWNLETSQTTRRFSPFWLDSHCRHCHGGSEEEDLPVRPASTSRW